MSTYPAPSPPYLGPAAHDSGSGNRPIRRIVMHSTVSPCEPGGGRTIARYFRSPEAGGSAHYIVDPSETVQAVYDGTIAWHAPPNGHSLGVEMCDQPSRVNAARWTGRNHRAMLARAATLVAQLCLAYDVPPRFLTVADLEADKRGITTHSNVSRAWRQSSHWDPGAWPRRRFMRMVRAEVDRITSGGAAAEEEDDMPAPKDWDREDWDAVRHHIFTADVIPVPRPLRGKDGKNETWQVRNALGRLLQYAHWAKVRQQRLIAGQGDIADDLDGDQDEGDQ